MAYIGATLPSLSETFVSGELLAVQAEGVRVVPVSVFPPRAEEMNPDFRSLAKATLVVYSDTTWRHAATELICRPRRFVRTLMKAGLDMLTSRDASLISRVKLSAQGFAAIGLGGRLRPLSPTHIHAHMANTPTTLAMYAASHLGIGFSFTGHANDLFVHRSLLPEKLRRAAFVACISHWHRAFYRGFVELPDARMPVVRCGVEIVNALGDQCRSDGTPGPLRILSVGRLVAKKGMETLIRAVARAPDSGSLSLEIVGDGPLREHLQSLVDSLGLHEQVSLLGPLGNAEVLRRVHSCDLFVLACQRDPATGDQDGIPVSLMEAMAAERCVITSNLSPIDELVIHEKTGLCVPPGDPDALAAAISRSAADVEFRQQLARAGRRHVEAEFSRAVNVDRLCSQFRAVTKARSRPIGPESETQPTDRDPSASSIDPSESTPPGGNSRAAVDAAELSGSR